MLGIRALDWTWSLRWLYRSSLFCVMFNQIRSRLWCLRSGYLRDPISSDRFRQGPRCWIFPRILKLLFTTWVSLSHPGTGFPGRISVEVCSLDPSRFRNSSGTSVPRPVTRLMARQLTLINHSAQSDTSSPWPFTWPWWDQLTLTHKFKSNQKKKTKTISAKEKEKKTSLINQNKE